MHNTPASGAVGMSFSDIKIPVCNTLGSNPTLFDFNNKRAGIHSTGPTVLVWIEIGFPVVPPLVLVVGIDSQPGGFTRS